MRDERLACELAFFTNPGAQRKKDDIAATNEISPDTLALTLFRRNSNRGDKEATQIPIVAVHRLFPINPIHTWNSHYDRARSILRIGALILDRLYIEISRDARFVFVRYTAIYSYTANVAANNASYARLAPTTLNLVDLANRMENGVVGRSIIGCCVPRGIRLAFLRAGEPAVPFYSESAAFSATSADRYLTEVMTTAKSRDWTTCDK